MVNSRLFTLCFFICFAGSNANNDSDIAQTECYPLSSKNELWKNASEALVQEESPGIMALASQLLPFKVGIGLATYMAPVTCIGGLLGNSLSIMVTFQKHNRHISSYFYMGMLAITDSVALALSLGYWAFKDIYGQVLDVWKHRVICSTVFPILTAAILCGTYLILAMTVDRLIAVKWPLKAMSWCSVKRAKISSAVVIFCCSLAKLPYVWVTVPVPPTYACFAFQGEKSTVTVLYYWFNTSVGCYIPFTILLTLNCMIIHAIRRRHSYFERKSAADLPSNEPATKSVSIESSSLDDITVISSSEKKSQQRENLSQGKNKIHNQNKGQSQGQIKGQGQGQVDTSITRMLLLVSFSFICLTAPIYIFYIVYLIKNGFASPETLAEYVLFGNIGNQMMGINYGINFYLYCLAGSKFRRDLWTMLKNMIGK